MKHRYLVAFGLIILLGIILTYEIIYLKTTKEILEQELLNTIESLKNDDFEKLTDNFENFIKQYEEKKDTLSIFIHESIIENINSLIAEIRGLIKSEKIGEIGGVLENLLGEIRELYDSVLPNIENIM